MRKWFLALILIALAVSSAWAQFSVAPEGAVIPNGALMYTVPTGSPILAWGGPEPWPWRLPPTELYPLLYPAVPVPIPPPGGSTSNRIKPPSASENIPLSELR